MLFSLNLSKHGITVVVPNLLKRDKAVPLVYINLGVISRKGKAKYSKKIMICQAKNAEIGIFLVSFNTKG